MPSVLLALDDQHAREAAAAALSDDPELEVLAAVADAPAAVRRALALAPDACVLGVGLPGGGIRAAWEVAARLPRTRIVVVGDPAGTAALLPAIHAGAAGYVLADAGPLALRAAVHEVLAGRAVLPGDLLADLLSALRDRAPRRRAPAQPGPGGAALTAREWEVLELLRAGRGTQEMARALTLTPATVRSHVAAVVRKTGAADRAAVAAC